MDQCLTDLEQRPADTELLAEIFRTVHTIKGTTGFLGFSRLEKLAHAGESLLGSLRDGRLTATTTLIGGLLRLMDGLRAIVRLIEMTGAETDSAGDDDSPLLALMQSLDQPQAESCDAAPEAADVHEPLPAETQVPASTSNIATLNDKTLRIDVDVLNRMMNLVGELVLTRNQIVQSNGQTEDFPELARRLDSVTADLRETVMQARMQPVGHLFGKFPRMVRDLSLSCGKCVRIEFSGQETGLDKSLLEAIKDPLTHAVRNAIDHGIEEPQARFLAGKPVEGVLKLRAYHHNGAVVIEIEDDGGGISTQLVLAKAVERGLVTAERASTMSERETLQLVFRPGFSTAARVTTVSGRGVGMDVVLANVQKVGGSVEIESRLGRGTVLRLRVPLTLAIVRALVVRSGGQSFCVPQNALAELVFVPLREAAASMEFIGASELFNLRGSLLPVVRLDRILGLQPQPGDQKGGFYLVILDFEGCRYGLLVDDLLTPEEIVVKPLSLVLREIGLFSGASILGTGALAMIVDVAALARRAGVKAAPEMPASAETPRLAATGRSSFLVFEERAINGRVQRMALPLNLVVRIESVAISEIEYAGDRPLLQYRGELLPLEDRGRALDSLGAADPEATVMVLICQRSRDSEPVTQRVGMVVGRVIEVAAGDLVETDAELCTERLAMVHDRLTVVHRGLYSGERLRDVA
jgi:two-component system chemotaxis sensor kinase CheA